MGHLTFSIITCDPPLGSVTILNGENAEFTVGVPARELEHGAVVNSVWIWHNHGGSWGELPLRESKTRATCSDSRERRFFRGSLPRGPEITSFKFTLRFETADHQTLWIKDLQGSEDGEVIWQAAGLPSRDINHYLEGLNKSGFEAIVVGKNERTVGSCLVWELVAPIPPAQGKESGRSSKRLCKPDCARWFATVRKNLNWFGPRQGTEVLQLDKEAVLVSLLRRDGLHLVLLPVSGLDDSITTLTTDHEGGLVAVSRNEQEAVGQTCVLVSVATDFEQALGSVMAQVKRKMASYGDHHHHHHHPLQEERHLHGSRPGLSSYSGEASDWYDGFAYCTWNSLGQNLSQEKIINALTQMSESGIHVVNLIIDDNWQSVSGDGSDASRRRWERFEANQEGFPHGLKGLVSEIRKVNPQIRNIAVWHGIFGYWGGMSPSGQIADGYKLRKISLRDEKEIYPKNFDFYTVGGEDVQRMYDDFYAFLADCGVSATKVDTQGFLDYPAHADDRRNLIRPYQDAWTTAASKHLGGQAIACMAQIPETIFYSLLQPLRGPAGNLMLMVRNSDDFFPNVVESHTWHVFVNAHNALLMRHLGVTLDWDMFQTTTPQYAGLHAAARSVSGGPIYITDTPGQHDLDLVGKMTARTADGRTIALRAHEAGRTVWPYADHSEPRLLRVRCGHLGAAMLGLFNTCKQSRPLAEQVKLGDFLDGERTDLDSFLIFRFSTGEIITPHDQDDVVELLLQEAGFEIFTAYPVTKLCGLAIAALGLLGKMAAAAALSHVSYSAYEHPDDNEPAAVQVTISLNALGTLGIFARPSTQEDARRAVLGSLVAKGKTVPDPQVYCSMGSQGEMRVDLESLWLDLGLYPSGRDDFSVDLVMVLQLV